MNLASLRIVPSMLVLLTRSEPARSTRFSFERRTVSSPACKDAFHWLFRQDHMLIVVLVHFTEQIQGWPMSTDGAFG